MKKNISKVLFFAGIAVMILGIISNVDSTLHFHATQFVPEGEKPDPLRVGQFIRDIIYPIYDGLILIGLSYLLNFVKKD
ncbi:hypothetical protein F4694_004400 [Bacillus niacini]|uniref:Uncharacterized protein n=1 Tax=Neobacillus niacini TaxID=86668 RepID=A0A852THC3_9BACI|nr:hypothetical protein [Neobacillus niacini]NYE07589.1 hypothetical protein [Neobacillus niacini]